MLFLHDAVSTQTRAASTPTDHPVRAFTVSLERLRGVSPKFPLIGL
jgi:hypothetical protein